MRYFFLLCIVFGSAIMGCNSHQNPGGDITHDSINSVSDSAINYPSTETGEELQKLPPYTIEQMKTLLPEELAGTKLSDPASGKTNGTAYANGTYPINDSTRVGLSLYDCGGSAGAGYYKYQFLNTLDAGSGEDEEKKVIDFNGSKAMELYNFNSYRSSFTYLNDRFLVVLESETLDMEALKKIALDLKLKQ